DKVLEVKVHVELSGTPVGVKVQGGILDFVTREIEIECLPTDIPDKVLLDVSGLELGKHIRASDLQLSDKVTLLTDPELVIVHVVAPRAEEAAATPDAEAAAAPGSEPEVIKKGKPEDGDDKGDKKADKKEKK
ncbi:MAG: 50S ribosomal protein L25, partial [Vicinamibacteria bacterium]